MRDILHDLPINATAARVFHAVSTPNELDAWWTKTSAGRAEVGEMYTLGFGPEYDWRAVVSRCFPRREFELRMTQSQKDWHGTRVGFILEEKNGVTHLRFYHAGWPEDNDHFRTSCFCWAMYLRLMKRFIEFGEIVSYEKRLDV